MLVSGRSRLFIIFQRFWRLLLLALFVPITLGGIYLLGQQVGNYEPNVGILLLVIGNIAGFLIVIWRGAEILHIADSARQKVQRELHQLRQTLEVQVLDRTLALRQSELQAMLDTSPQYMAVLDQHNYHAQQIHPLTATQSSLTARQSFLN